MGRVPREVKVRLGQVQIVLWVEEKIVELN